MSECESLRRNFLDSTRIVLHTTKKNQPPFNSSKVFALTVRKFLSSFLPIPHENLLTVFVLGKKEKAEEKRVGEKGVGKDMGGGEDVVAVETGVAGGGKEVKMGTKRKSKREEEEEEEEEEEMEEIVRFLA
jgi:hypothetical protein